MAHIGVHFDCLLPYDLKTLDNGFVVPDESMHDIQDRQRQHVDRMVDLAVRADELGYDFVVHPENHFNFLGSSSPNPLQLQTLVADRTDDIRLLQVANILPWHTPVRLAEQTATIDVVSDGRLEVGIGTGSGPRQLHTFAQYRSDGPEDDYDTWADFLEAYEILVEAWTEDFLRYDGQYHTYPPADVEWENDQEFHYLADDGSGCRPEELMYVEDGDTLLKSVPVFPQPVQQPHPQLWKPAVTSRSTSWAAERGINVCTFGANFADVSNLVETYHEAAEAAGWPDHRPEYDGTEFGYGWDEDRRRGVAAEVPVFNTEVADEAALERMKLGQEFLMSGQKSVLPSEEAAKTPIDADLKIESQDAPIVGDGEEIVDQLARFAETCGYEDFVVFLTIGTPGMTTEQKLSQLDALAETVVPYFADE